MRLTYDFLKVCIFKHAYTVSSVAQSCPTLCDSMDCSTPGFPVHHQLPGLIQTHVHRVCDAIHLILRCPLLLERLFLNHAKTPGFLASEGEEFNPGPETRLDRSELLSNKILLKYKGDRESF